LSKNSWGKDDLGIKIQMDLSSMKQQLELCFEGECSYDEAVDFYNGLLSRNKFVKETVGTLHVYKENNYWIMKQEVKLTLFTSIKIFFKKMFSQIMSILK